MTDLVELKDIINKCTQLDTLTTDSKTEQLCVTDDKGENHLFSIMASEIVSNYIFPEMHKIDPNISPRSKVAMISFGDHDEAYVAITMKVSVILRMLTANDVLFLYLNKNDNADKQSKARDDFDYLSRCCKISIYDHHK